MPFEQPKSDKMNGRENLIAKTKNIFSELKKANLEAKEKGEYYDPHFDDIDPETITEQEALLFDQLGKINSVDDYKAFGEDLKLETIKISKEQKSDIRGRNGVPRDPHQNFLAYLGNKAIAKYSEIMKAKGLL